MNKEHDDSHYTIGFGTLPDGELYKIWCVECDCVVWEAQKNS